MEPISEKRGSLSDPSVKTQVPEYPRIRAPGIMALLSSRSMTETADTLYDGRFLRLMRRGQWEYAERVNPGGAVAIVAVTPDGELLLTEQFRVPLGHPVIELPAGLVGDEPGRESEDWEAAAARELEEETGWRAGRFERLTEGPTTAGMSNETVVLVRARELQRVGVGGGDATESIRVHAVPVAKVAGWLAEREREGLPPDPKVFAGLFFLLDQGQ